MKVSLEWFLLDNMALNRLLVYLASALSGVAVPPSRAIGVSLLGALWDWAALARFSWLLGLPGRILCLSVTALLLSKKAFWRMLLSLLFASLLLGGGLLLFLSEGVGPGGVILATMPLRAAVYGLCLLPVLGRAGRYLVQRGYEDRQQVDVVLEVGHTRYGLKGFVDSGNLLTEPVSGLPVVLIEGIALPPGRPLPVEGQGVVELVYARLELPGRPPVPVFVGASPVPLPSVQALLPAAAVIERGKNDYVAKAAHAVVWAIRPLVHPAVSLLSHAQRGKPACAPQSGGGACVPAGGGGERSGPQPAH